MYIDIWYIAHKQTAKLLNFIYSFNLDPFLFGLIDEDMIKTLTKI